MEKTNGVGSSPTWERILIDERTRPGLEASLSSLIARKVVYPEDWNPLEDGSEDARPGARLKREKEVYSVCRLVKCVLPELSGLPFSLTHREKPDFLVRSGFAEIGIEHTEMIPQAEAYRRRIRADMVAAGEEVPDMWFIKPASPTDPVPKRSDIESSIRCDIPGDGWVGEEHERQWTIAVLAFVGEKVRKSSGYERFQRNWLLVYDAWPTFGPRLSIAGPMVHGGLMSCAAYDRFDTVFILNEQDLVRFERSGFSAQALRSAGLKPS